MLPADPRRLRTLRMLVLCVPGVLVATCALAFDWPLAPALAATLLATLVPAHLLLARSRHQQASQGARNQAFIQRLIDVIPQPVYVKDANSNYLMVNRALAEMTGRPIDELVGRPSVLFTGAEHTQTTLQEDARVLAGARIHKELRDTNPHTGKQRERLIMKGSCLSPEGQLLIVGTNFDITPWRETERALQESLAREATRRQSTEAFVQRLIDVIPDPVYVKDTHSRYLLVNKAFCQYRGLEREYITSHEFPPAGPVTSTRQVSMDEDLAILAGQEVLKEECVLRKVTGEEVHRIVHKRRSLYLDGSPVIIGINHDITRWRVAERALNKLAQEDPLTGFANRRAFERQAGLVLERAARYPEPVSLILLDLDHFKRINDAHGHQAGDQVLLNAVRRLSEGLRRHDVAGRWGGEEFIFLLPHTALEEARRVATRLCEGLAARPLPCDSLLLAVTLSAGVTQHIPGEPLGTLIARADAALYRAKDSGRNRVEAG
ncbi:MAG: diguanylate cyclase [Candidatus Dactylopiibacterium sp.]|nr:diguanylate cyclase [Candidatus Dactylopiibacterium sp.]